MPEIESDRSCNHQKSSWWNHSIPPLQLDTSTAAQNPSANHKTPLAPKQELRGNLANSRNQHQTPVAGTYALGTPRRKITSIACERCRQRKSKCDGIRPTCNTCQKMNLSCTYNVAKDGKTTTQLRAQLQKLAKELDDMKSLVLLLTLSPNRSTAARWASELEKNGFAHYTADEIRKALQEVDEGPRPLQHEDPLGTLGSDGFQRAPRGLAASSYDGSSREDSREHSQPTVGFYSPESAMNSMVPFNVDPTTSEAVTKFGFDCALYERTTREILANGWTETQIFGRVDTDVDTLILGWEDPQNGQPVPTWASRMANKMLAGCSIPLRLASAFLLTKMMRWLIWPSVENRNAMPDWLMPLTKFIHGTFLGQIKVNWPYTDEACHYWDAEAGCTRLTSLFENHITDLNNWTLDAKVMETFPQIEGLVPVQNQY